MSIVDFAILVGLVVTLFVALWSILDDTKDLKRRNSYLRARLFSMRCKVHTGRYKSFYCPECGKPLSRVVVNE